jgi:UDP-N-acetylmuramoylalanine--D-glutamate ligase
VSARARADVHAALRGQAVLVMGLGSFGGGVGAARYLARLGARVLVTDLRSERELAPALERLAGLGVRTALDGHRPRDFATAELVVANPAVKPDDPLLGAARRAGARVTSEIELFLEAVAGRVACVTGTQGKSSTSHMLAALLGAAGIRAHLGGNIGGSLLESLDQIGADDVVVLELSSYQLEALADASVLRARAEAVAIVNVLLDHLERHKTAAAYRAAKLRILDLVEPGGVALLPGWDPKLQGPHAPPWRRVSFWRRGQAGPGLSIAAGAFTLDGEELGRTADLSLPGEFQQENALVALGMARCLGATRERLAAAIGALRGLSHRLEDLGWRAGRRVRDNGVSTTPDSTVSALDALPLGVTLLCGGKRKDLPLDELVTRAREREVLAICFGEAGPSLAGSFSLGGVRALAVAGLEDAVAQAFERTPRGGEVLFSPACASFDAYLNFEQRARAFRAALPALDPPDTHRLSGTP